MSTCTMATTTATPTSRLNASCNDEGGNGDESSFTCHLHEEEGRRSCIKADTTSRTRAEKVRAAVEKLGNHPIWDTISFLSRCAWAVVAAYLCLLLALVVLASLERLATLPWTVSSDPDSLVGVVLGVIMTGSVYMTWVAAVKYYGVSAERKKMDRGKGKRIIELEEGYGDPRKYV